MKKWSGTFLRVITLKNVPDHFFIKKPKTNVHKVRNSILLSLLTCFQDGRQNHTESYIVVYLSFNVFRNMYGGSVLVFVLLCISMSSFYF